MREFTKVPDILRGECPVHGVEDFKWSPGGNLWACLGTLHLIEQGKTLTAEQSCSSCILREDFTPDGYDVIDALQTKWFNVTFEHGRYEAAWLEYYYWVQALPNV